MPGAVLGPQFSNLFSCSVKPDSGVSAAGMGPVGFCAKPLFSSLVQYSSEVNKMRWQVQILGHGKSEKERGKEGGRWWMRRKDRQIDGWMSEWTDG